MRVLLSLWVAAIATVAILAACARLLVGCAPAPVPALAPVEGRAAAIQLSMAVQTAAELCTANARHLSRIDEARSTRLFDACTAALLPARDAVVFVLPGLDPWTPSSSAAVGCAGKAVRVALERTRQAFIENGYTGPVPGLFADGLVVGRRLEVRADASCDPLRPTSSTTLFVDPRIPVVEPDYPTRFGP